MAQVAKQGVIVFSRDIKKLAAFYIQMFDLVLQRECAEFVSLGHDGVNIIIYASPIEMDEPSCHRVRLFLTVASHEVARKKVVALGGQVLDGVYSNPIFKLCNICDPDGNVIQIREFIKN